MPHYTPLWQGEGISAPDTVGAGTGALYSCIGIAFANRSTRRGGLYHYPALTLDNPVISETIHQMMIDIQPDEIVVTPALSTAAGIGSPSQDVAAITNLLQRYSSANTTIRQEVPKVSAEIVWNTNGPIFNQQPFQALAGTDYDSDESLGEHELRAQNSAIARDLGEGVFYYGADIEHNPDALGPTQAGPSITGLSAPAQPGRTRFKKGSRRKWIRERCIPS